MSEDWMVVEGFPDYAVSSYGYVQNMRTGRILSRSPIQYGMLTAPMMYEGKQYRRSIATLVAKAFLPQPEDRHFDTPIHLDGDRANCHVDNLAWRPRWFAMSYNAEVKRPPFGKWTHDIRLLDTGEIFEHPREAAEKYGLLQSEIHRSLVNGTQCFPYGYKFIYLE